MNVRKKVCIGLLLLIAWLCLLGLCWYFIFGWMNRQGITELAEMVEQAENAVTYSNGSALAQAFISLRQCNPDFGGWLAIEGTRINYPVMHTPEEPEKYLRKNFDGRYSMMGLPFLYAGCDWDASANLIVYGHNMQSGDIFAGLMQYLDEEYGKAHPLIQLDTPGDRRVYHVMAVIPFEITAENENTYYQCSGMSDKEEFGAYVEFLKKNSVYDTGVTAAWGEQLLMLSTCSDYTTGPGRLLVVGRLESRGSYEQGKA